MNENMFPVTDGINLYTKNWLPDNDIKAVIIIIHGLAEHIERYNHVGNSFSLLGYAVEAYDLRGHGKSEGKRTFIGSIYEHVFDLKIYVNYVKEKYPGKQIFLLGHSMGGEISCLYSIEYQSEISGLILSGAVIKISDDISPILQKFSGVIAAIFPNLPTTKIDSRGISSDKNVVELYDNDPLVYRGGTLARTGAEIIKGTRDIKKDMKRITIPILIMHGTSDSLSDPKGSNQLYNGVTSSDKTLKLYENFYHEILNEPKKEKVIQDITHWIDERCD